MALYNFNTFLSTYKLSVKNARLMSVHKLSSSFDLMGFDLPDSRPLSWTTAG